MAHHIAALEIAAVLGLEQAQVLREAVGVIAGVEPGHEDVLRARLRQRACIDPEDTELAQLLRAQGIGGARVAPAHVPGIFHHHRGAALFVDRLAVERLIGLAEPVLDHDRDLVAGRHPDGPVVRGLDPAIAGQRVEQQVLAALRVHHAEPDRQHEFRALEGDLQRAQHAAALLGVLLQVHLGDEELHALLDVGAEHVRGAVGDLVAVVLEPGFEPVRLGRGQDQDVVFADHVFGLDGHALGPGLLLPVGKREPGARRRGAKHPLHDDDGLARIRIEIFDQPRRGEGVQMIDNRVLGHMDLLALKHGRGRDHHGEILGLALEVVDHGDDGAVAVAHHHHLGRLVEELSIALGNEKAAEGERLGRGGQKRDGRRRDSKPLCQGFQEGFHVAAPCRCGVGFV